MNPFRRSVSYVNESRAHRWVAILLAIGLGAIGTTCFARFVVGSNGPMMVATVQPLPNNEVQPLVAENDAMEAVAHRIMPTVVEIDVTARETPSADQGQPDMSQLPPQFRQFFGFGNGGPQQPQYEQAEGSGVIISPDGYIVTNNHVVQGATSLTVITSNLESYQAKVVGTDPSTDLAVIKVNATNLPSAPFGDSNQLQLGEKVLAFGQPMGDNFSVTSGIISALHRNRPGDPRTTRGDFIQTDAAINPGNSGGPLVDVNGEVIGINSMIESESGNFAGIGFAIPSDLVKETAQQLMATGKVVRGYLGVMASTVLPAQAKSLDDGNTPGALVNQVDSGSPAQSAGLKVYDLITAVNGTKITSSDQLQSVIGDMAPGTTVHVSVMRDGQTSVLPVTLGTFGANNSNGESAASATPAPGPKLGIQAGTTDPQTRQMFNIPDSVNGLVVNQVNPGGAAYNAGIQPGDVIEQANRKQVTSIDELQSQLNAVGPGNTILLLVWHQGQTEILTVELPGQ